MRILRHPPSPSLAIALVALFVALGGPAQAKRLIDGKLLRKGTVTGRAIKNGSVGRADLSRAAIRSLTATPANSVASAQIIDGQVLAPDLGTGSVTSAALAPTSVTASKVAADAVGGGSVANGSLQTVDIGSFAGAIQVDFPAFDSGDKRCQVADAPAVPAGDGQPNLGDDVIAVSPPAGLSDYLTVSARPLPGNVVRLRVCWVPNVGAAPLSSEPPDPGPMVFRYVTFDSP